MCLAIAKNPGKSIPKRWLKNAYSSNSDGCGFAHIGEDGQIKAQRFLFGFRRFYSALRLAERENPKSPFLIHFRLATHGSVSEENCHPFVIDNGNKRVAAIHNGILSIDVPKGSDDSDTAIFLRKVITPNLGKVMNDPIIRGHIEKAVGSNKLVFLTEKRKFIFLNERLGHWRDGVWYSNSCYNNYSSYGKYGLSGTQYGWHANDDVCWIGKYGGRYQSLGSLTAIENEVDKLERERQSGGFLLQAGESDGEETLFMKCDICDANVPEDDIKECKIEGAIFDFCFRCYEEWGKNDERSSTDTEKAWGYDDETKIWRGHGIDL